MNKKGLKKFLEEFDEEVEIVIIDSLGSEFSIDRVEQQEGKAAIILKRSYKNMDNKPLLLKLEKDRNGKNKHR